MSLVSESFLLAVRAAAPAMIALLLATLVLGLIGRTLPQLNILVLGFGINSLVVLSHVGCFSRSGSDFGVGLFRTGIEDAAGSSRRTLITESTAATGPQARRATPFDIEAACGFAFPCTPGLCP